jgi:hypothetical protein
MIVCWLVVNAQICQDIVSITDQPGLMPFSHNW